MKKVLSSLFLFAFIIVFSNVSMVYASTSNTKTIKTPSSILSDYAKKMEQKETQITKKQEERQKALEKAKKERCSVQYSLWAFYHKRDQPDDDLWYCK